MKKIGITKFFFLLLIPIIGQSQIDIKNLSLIDSNKRIIYIGIENNFQLIGIKDFSSLKIKSKNSEIKKFNLSDNKFIVNSIAIGTDTIRIYQKNKIIANFIYNVERLGILKCKLGTISSNFATINEIVTNPEINLYVEGSFVKINCKIFSFEAFCIQENDTTSIYEPLQKGLIDTTNIIDPITLKERIIIEERIQRIEENYSNRLSKFQIEVIKKLKKGDKIYLKRIKVHCSDSMGRIINELAIEII